VIEHDADVLTGIEFVNFLYTCGLPTRSVRRTDVDWLTGRLLARRGIHDAANSQWVSRRLFVQYDGDRIRPGSVRINRNCARIASRGR
jgi:hypothetical protein